MRYCRTFSTRIKGQKTKNSIKPIPGLGQNSTSPRLVQSRSDLDQDWAKPRQTNTVQDRARPGQRRTIAGPNLTRLDQDRIRLE